MASMPSASGDPFQLALADLQAVLGELQSYQAEPMTGPEMAQNALASQAASGAEFGPSTPQNALAAYDVNQPVEPVSAAREIPREGAAALVGVNALTAGALPYITAGVKKLAGNEADFDTLRRDEQMRVEGARNALGEMALPVEMLTPMGGVGLLARGARSAESLAARSAGAGAAYGGVRGYLEPMEPGSLDAAERLSPALWGAATGAGTGYGMGRAAGAIGNALTSRAVGLPDQPAPVTPVPSRAEQRIAMERGRQAIARPRQRPDGEPLPPVQRIERIRDMFAQGKDLLTIARELGESGEDLARSVTRANDSYMPGGYKLHDDRIQAAARQVLSEADAYRVANPPKPRASRAAGTPRKVSSAPLTEAPARPAPQAARPRNRRAEPATSPDMSDAVANVYVSRMSPGVRQRAQDRVEADLIDSGRPLPKDGVYSDSDIMRGYMLLMSEGLI